jgi:outer membrane autotransporter protein
MGISLSWANLDIHNDVSSSKTTANSYQGTLYTSFDFNCPLFMTGALGVAYNNYKIARNIIFNDIELFPSAEFNGIQTGAKAEIGYVYSFKTYEVIPLASLFYSHLNLHDYQEKGAGNASQSIREEDFDTLQAGVGVKLVDSYEINKCYLLQAEVHIMGFYDAFNDRMQTTSQFVGAGPSFKTFGFTPARGSLNLGTSFALFNIFDYVFTGEYDFYAKEDYRAHSGFLRMRYEFS